jgi:hypothetical protein
MATIVTGVGYPGTISTASGGKVTAATPTTTPQQVIGPRPERQSIVFANPGSVAVFVYPLLLASGLPNSPSVASPQGSFQVLGGGLLTITGECQLAWGAFAASGTGAITIMESNV